MTLKLPVSGNGHWECLNCSAVPPIQAALIEEIAAQLKRARISADLTQQLVRRSFEQIAKSRELLASEVPKVCHPEPRKK
ncbi:hypothetical protein QA640_06320 [Bradyrhizobium sp. CB82]|uniref:hypothetical protein n=1 Tax=Bradyrhizobium sp. CB82 TaxID=3039159 RepID=UPI0024B0DBF9|nr:hypothetical protein [Bradyrhizobium sp. CB82]WFU42105.1 hypothetical protein QA640_06320 [Bradyrhizobium sp. CB82]